MIKINEYKLENKKHTDEEMQKLLVDSFDLYCKKMEENGATIISCEKIIERNIHAMTITAKIVLHQECGVQMKIVDF